MIYLNEQMTDTSFYCRGETVHRWYDIFYNIFGQNII